MTTARTPLEAAGDALNSCLHGAPSGKEMAANVVAAYLRAEAGNCPNLGTAGLFRIMAAEVEREGSGG